MNDELISSIEKSWKQRNVLDQVTLPYLTLYLYGMSSYLNSYDEMSQSSLQITFSLLKNILQSNIVKSTPSIEHMLIQMLEDLYSNIKIGSTMKNKRQTWDQMRELQDLMTSVSTMRSKNRVQEMTTLVTTTEFSTIATNNLWSREYVNMKVELPSKLVP